MNFHSIRRRLPLSYAAIALLAVLALQPIVEKTCFLIRPNRHSKTR